MEEVRSKVRLMTGSNSSCRSTSRRDDNAKLSNSDRKKEKAERKQAQKARDEGRGGGGRKRRKGKRRGRD